MTSQITLFYKITQKQLHSPDARELERKKRWTLAVQRTVEDDNKPKIIKVTYSVHNPQIEKQRRFFEGPVVKYYCIQNEDMTDTLPSTTLLTVYRIDILDQVLGYDVHLHNRVIRERNSTTKFKEVQDWNRLLKTIEETIFDAAGYDFPDSENFWELVKKHGYEEAERISIEKLQNKLKKIHHE